MEKTTVNRTNKCVLKCNEPTQLFDFPSEDAVRALWLYKLGLDKYDENLQVCDRHFSRANQSDIAIPDQNLPENIERKESYDKLIERIRSTKIVYKTNTLNLVDSESFATKKEVNPHPEGKDMLSGNGCSSTAIKETQSKLGDITQSEREFDHSIIGEESQPSSGSKTMAENETPSTIIDEEDDDPISEFMRLASDEPPSKMFDKILSSNTKSMETSENVSSSNTTEANQINTTSEAVRPAENKSFSTVNQDLQSYIEDVREENEFTPTIIEETKELTENELSLIIEEDPQTDEALPATSDSQIVLPSDTMPSTSSETLPPSKSHSPPQTKENLINDTSTFLLDYQLCIQGKYMCDVIEIPEYVVVITIPKAKELRPQTQLAKNNDFVHGKKERSLLNIPPSITISRTLSEEPEDNRGTESQQTENIDYVYYMGEDENPRRDREIQVDIEITTKDSANQCDVELDVNMIPIDHEPKLCNSAADFNKRECLVCGEILINYLAQVKHFALHESELTSLCSYCGARFANPQKLIAHEKYFHVGIMTEIKEPIRCPRLYCQKVFHSKKQLNNHIDEHIGNVGHKCYICLRVFTSSLQLFRHQKLSNLCMKRKMWKQRMFFRRMLEC